LKEVFHILDTQTWIAAERRRGFSTFRPGAAAKCGGLAARTMPIRTTRKPGAADRCGADEIADSWNSPDSSFQHGGLSASLVIDWTVSYPHRAGKH